MMIATKCCIRLFIISLLSLIGCQFAFAQAGTINHWESVIYANDTWRYFIGISEPSSNWKTVLFDDTNWLQGTGGIGYGDGDDNTVIDPCISLYMRIKFTIHDLSKIEKAILHVDYDDSFVAYLNDVEIARVGVPGNPPAYNQLADGNHEANAPGGGIPSAFTIEKNDLLNCLQENENVLALQIHNVAENSSDMSSTTYFSVGINDDSYQYREIPDWFTAPFDFSSSDIPIMVIDMEGRQIVDEPKTMGRMGIINNGEGQRNTLGDSFNEYDGWIGIEYRGNASMVISDKKPYTFETRREDGADTNVVLLGLPRENDFILRAAYIDKTLMRDPLAYHVSRKLGYWAPRTRHVELVLNGNYEGTYILVEKIKPDNNRLDIIRMDSTDISGEAVTGGYIWSVQQSDGNDVVFLSDASEGNNRVLKYPKPDEVTPEQFEYIRQYEESFRTMMRSPDYNDPVSGYPAYIEPSTFIDEIILQEATSNSDAYGWSSYFYKDRNKKMCAGPAWDFDQALCNSTYNDGDRTDEFLIEKPDWARPSFWDILWEDPDFNLELKRKWNTYRQGPLKTDELFAFIDSVANYLHEAQQHNFNRWPILGQEIWRSLPGATDRDTYQKEVDYMKNWLSAHLNWMDQQLYLAQPPDSENNVIEEGLVAYYKFDEENGAIIDDYSGNNLHGTIVGNAIREDGKYGGALLFDGIDAFVNCGNSNNFNISEEISLMAWVKSFDIGNSEHNPWITKGDHAWALKEVSSGELEFFIYDNGWNTNHQTFDPATINNWHHFAGVYDGQQLKVYVDGELKNTTSYNGAINVTQDEVHLAHNSEVGDRFFNGLLDEVRIYNIALSDARISDIYNNLDTPVPYSPSPKRTDFSLHQNYPNPFNPTTNITYHLPKSSNVELSIYNLVGQKVAILVSERQQVGQHQVQWDATGFPCGIYYYIIKAGEYKQVKKMVLVR